MKALCVNDSNRPNEVPKSNWVKLGQEYTVTRVMKLNIQNTYGVELAEIDLKPFSPYEYFSADRFAFDTVKDLEEVAEEAISSS